jgi:hypothetical protein
MSDWNNSVEFAVEIEGGSLHYVGEFDMTDWDKGWRKAWDKAVEIAEGFNSDPELMELKPVDAWLQNAVSIFKICNERNKRDSSDWFTFEVVMDINDAHEVKELLDKYSDSRFLKDLLAGYESWGDL